MFKMYDCDIGITVNGVSYDFQHVDEVSVEDPVRLRLIRGANAKDKVGIEYMEGVKEPKTVSVTSIALPLELYNLLQECFDEKIRLDLYCISRSDGSSMTAKNAILAQEPRQSTINDSPESLNIPLSFESFDVKTVRKS